MGYTHYWYREKSVAPGDYLRIVMDFKKLFSAYEQDGQPKIWIITEADRSATTVLFPEEY
uniref:Uncharacterized protein n=1 Tax=viral metagenome TaxID=1070528 RepID=A0A6M3J7I9_9ZZZZ